MTTYRYDICHYDYEQTIKGFMKLQVRVVISMVQNTDVTLESNKFPTLFIGSNPGLTVLTFQCSLAQPGVMYMYTFRSGLYMFTVLTM